MSFLTTPYSSVQCSICSIVIDPSNLSGCYGCGESICDDCPHFACSCIDDEPTMRVPRLRLRQYAIELAELRNLQILFGQQHLTGEQEARLLLLKDVVTSLTKEVRLMDEKKHGELYAEDEPYPEKG